MSKENTYIGVDIGGTKIFAVRTDKNSAILDSIYMDTEADQGRTKVLDNLNYAISCLVNETTKGIGIAFAGLIDHTTGTVIKAPHIADFEHFPLAEKLEKKFKMPVYVDNDARLFALGEAMIGRDKQYSNLIGIVLGSGVGSGIIANGEILRGHDGFAGEIGHMYIDLYNDIEAEELFSGEGLKGFLTKAGLQDNTLQNILDWQNRQGKAWFEVEKWITYFAVNIANLILIFNPEIIVFGGGVGKNLLPRLLPHLKEKIIEILHDRGYKLTVNIEISALENAGAIGAAYCAQHDCTLPLTTNVGPISSKHKKKDTNSSS